MPETSPTTPETPAEQPLKLTEREIALAQRSDPYEPVAETPNTDSPVTDEPTGEGTDAPETKDTEPVAGKIEPPWLTAEIEREADTFGLTKDDLLDLGDEDAYKRTKRVLERNLYAAGQQTRQAQPAVAKEGEQGKEAQPPAKPKFQKHDLEKLKKEGYDESTLALYATVNQLIDADAAKDQVIQAVQQEKAQQAYQQHLHEFHSTLDGIDEDLFGKQYKEGKPVKLGKDFDENRRKVYDVAETIVAGIFAKAQAAGREPSIPPMPVLLLRARDYAFADKIRERNEARAKADAANKQKQLVEQSKRRRPVGRPAQTAPTAATEPDHAKRIATHPDILKFWAKAQEENGVAA